MSVMAAPLKSLCPALLRRTSPTPASKHRLTELIVELDCVVEKPIKKGKKKLLESRCSPSYIHDMMSMLTKNNSIEKLVEIDQIGFGFLRLVPNWPVKQAIMVHLAESYQVKTRTFILDVGNFRLNAELIEKVFDISSGGEFHSPNN
ncbi:hypothetical protein AHAS_Ahas05G0064100 [Arachis hypogaea]